jgi:hypothetical protein
LRQRLGDLQPATAPVGKRRLHLGGIGHRKRQLGTTASCQRYGLHRVFRPQAQCQAGVEGKMAKVGEASTGSQPSRL